jgi:CubicO group peptidase (beta-lactamase class C family)
MIGAVPATQTRAPTRTAREYPTRASNAVPEEMSCRVMRLVSPFVEALRQIEDWQCPHAAAIVTGRAEAMHGESGFRFPWASVTKLATAVSMLVAAEEGIVDLDEAAGPPGSTLRHLLAHASGLPFEEGAPIAPPGRRRIYSNYGFEQAAALVEQRAEMPFTEYFHHVWAGTAVRLEGSAGSGVSGTIEDLGALAHELQEPHRVAGETLEEAVTVQFPGLDGVVPGFGRQSPNDWGLGFELRDAKSPHWTGTRNSARTFGHFGRSGTFLWVDPEAGIALGVLTDRPFGDWAKDAWPRLSDAVLQEVE